MDGDYRKREGDEIVEPLFAALGSEEAGPSRASRRRRALFIAVLAAGLALGTWLIVRHR